MRLQNAVSLPKSVGTAHLEIPVAGRCRDDDWQTIVPWQSKHIFCVSQGTNSFENYISVYSLASWTWNVLTPPPFCAFGWRLQICGPFFFFFCCSSKSSLIYISYFYALMKKFLVSTANILLSLWLVARKVLHTMKTLLPCLMPDGRSHDDPWHVSVCLSLRSSAWCLGRTRQKQFKHDSTDGLSAPPLHKKDTVCRGGCASTLELELSSPALTRFPVLYTTPPVPLPVFCQHSHGATTNLLDSKWQLI